jgi:hypothetical protein
MPCLGQSSTRGSLALLFGLDQVSDEWLDEEKLDPSFDLSAAQ